MLNNNILRYGRKNKAFDLDKEPCWPTKFMWFWFGVMLIGLMLAGSCHADIITDTGYTPDQWVNAIHKAEGNDNYGIKSTRCTVGDGCRNVCERTVLNNYKRWKQEKSNIAYVQYLGKRYAPIGSGNDPTGLNRNWSKNVKYFLSKG